MTKPDKDTPEISGLNWVDHPSGLGGLYSLVNFPNGYSASVIKGGPFYTKGGTYEIAVMHGGDLDYTTPITDDVMGYLSEVEANKVMKYIAALPQKLPQ